MIKNVKICKNLRISGVVRTSRTTQQKGEKLPEQIDI